MSFLQEEQIISFKSWPTSKMVAEQTFIVALPESVSIHLDPPRFSDNVRVCHNLCIIFYFSVKLYILTSVLISLGCTWPTRLPVLVLFYVRGLSNETLYPNRMSVWLMCWWDLKPKFTHQYVMLDLLLQRMKPNTDYPKIIVKTPTLLGGMAL